MGGLVSLVKTVVLGPLKYLAQFAKWFYLTFIPFVLQYIGIPLFVLGMLLALSYALGVLLFIIIFSVFMYFFVKGTLVNTKPVIIK